VPGEAVEAELPRDLRGDFARPLGFAPTGSDALSITFL
jgi:hypothetical protein